MNINRIDNTNFNGMYKIPYSAKNMQELKDFVLPTYKGISNEPVFIFSGNNPFKVGLDTIMETIAKSNNSSIEWLKMNAKNHGIELPDNNDTLHIISTEKDIKKLLEYMIKRVQSKKPTFVDKLKKFFGIAKAPEYDENLPQHLLLLSEALKIDSQEAEAFKEYSKDFKKAGSAKELFKLLMSER